MGALRNIRESLLCRAILFCLLCSLLVSVAMISPQDYYRTTDSSILYYYNIPNCTYPRRQQLLLMTSYRSGSSFVGEFFQQNSDMFYMFEPLILLALAGDNRNLTNIKHNEAFILQKVLNCDLHYLWNRAKEVNPDHKRLGVAWFARIFTRFKWLSLSNVVSFVHGYVTANADTKGLIDITERQCRSYKHVTAKTIRVQTLDSIIPTLTLAGPKILNLVRDPRGVISSRIKIEQGDLSMEEYLTISESKEWIANEISTYCDNIKANIDFLTNIKRYCPLCNISHVQSAYRMVRYEDVAYSPEYFATQMYSFLGEDVPSEVLTWIQKSTTKNPEFKDLFRQPGAVAKQFFSNPLETGLNLVGSHYSTARNSTRTAEAWRRHLPQDIVTLVERRCNHVMQSLGYYEAGDKLYDDSQSLVGDLNVPFSIK